MRISKKTKSEIDRQIIELLKESQEKVFIKNKRIMENDRRVPLVSWLRSVNQSQLKSAGGSKIMALGENNSVRLRYSALWHSASEVVDWIAGRTPLTSWQVEEVGELVFRRHSGRCTYRYGWTKAEYSVDCQITQDQLKHMMHKYAKGNPPLRFLVHPRLADLILIKTLFNTINKD